MSTMQPALRCQQLTKRFGQVTALHEVSLQLDPGKTLALLGPSGCGKTTLLRLIAGFDAPTSGSIQIGDRVVCASGAYVPPERRNVGMVFQDYALFPHLTVRQNVGFGLPQRAANRKTRVNELLQLVGLDNHENRYPHQLSGGEQQRVALARTLAPQPKLVLLDEPFSNLDTELRREVRGEVKHILKTLEATAILVTHDQEEAFELGDQVALLYGGRLEQTGPTLEVYRQPATPFVARFLGKADFLPARVANGAIETELGTLVRPPRVPQGNHLHVLVRPEHLEVSVRPFERGVPATVITNKTAGFTSVHCLQLASGRRVHSAALGPVRFPEGTVVYARLNVSAPVLFTEVDEQAHCLFNPDDGPCCRDPKPRRVYLGKI